MLKYPNYLARPYWIQAALSQKEPGSFLYDLIIEDSQEVRGDILVASTSSKSQLGNNSSYKDGVYNYGNRLNLGSVKSQNDLIPKLNKCTKIIGEELCNTKDQTLINHLWINHISVIFAQKGKNGYRPGEFNKKDHKTTLDLLKKCSAPPFFITKDYAVPHLPDSYLVLAHSDLSNDIRETFGNNFQEEYQYPSNQDEFGYAEKARFFLTPLMPIREDEFGNPLYYMMYIGGKTTGGIKTSHLPLKIYLPKNVKNYCSLSWLVKLGYINFEPNHIVNLVVTSNGTEE